MFDGKKSMEELEEDNERAEVQLKLAEKKALIAECNRRYGKGGWKMFSGNGMQSGIDWQALKLKIS